MINVLYFLGHNFNMASTDYWKSKFDEWYAPRKSDFADSEAIWSDQSKRFREYWNNEISNPKSKISDTTIEEMIRILDTNARGNRKANAVAKLYLRQTMQEDLLKNINSDPKKVRLLNKFFTSVNESDKISAIDELYSYEKGKGGARLTSPNGVFLNAMAYAYDPSTHVNIVSLDAEKSAIETLGIPTTAINFESDSYGKRIVLSNKILLDFFRGIGVTEHTTVIASFIWFVLNNDATEPRVETAFPTTFVLEKLLEDFLVFNWDRIEKFRENDYEILTEDGEIKGRQYPAGSGKIDILAKEKGTGNFVVIELKRNQTSDTVAGQILRYMNWVKINLAKGKEVKGIVIAGDIDDGLKLALSDRKDIQLMRYEVNFKLNDEPIK